MNLLNNLGKKPYQAYRIEHGIEVIRVQIPLKEARNFETEFADAQTAGKNKESLMAIVARHGGTVRAPDPAVRKGT
jgi:hypothetical protein